MKILPLMYDISAVKTASDKLEKITKELFTLCLKTKAFHTRTHETSYHEDRQLVFASFH